HTRSKRDWSSDVCSSDLVERLDALGPGVNLGLVDITGGRGVLEEQGQRQALIDVLGCLCIRIDNLLVANFVGIFEVFEVVVGQVRCRVVDTTQATFFTNFNLGRNRVDR